jgi:hypothetical protein
MQRNLAHPRPAVRDLRGEGFGRAQTENSNFLPRALAA